MIVLFRLTGFDVTQCSAVTGITGLTFRSACLMCQCFAVCMTVQCLWGYSQSQVLLAIVTLILHASMQRHSQSGRPPIQPTPVPVGSSLVKALIINRLGANTLVKPKLREDLVNQIIPRACVPAGQSLTGHPGNSSNSTRNEQTRYVDPV